MEGIALLRRAVAELRAGRAVVESVVLAREGTASRAPGARMLTFADGSHGGTIGGGPHERRCQHIAREVLEDGAPRLEVLDQGAGPLACGGVLTVGVRKLGEADRAVLAQALSWLDADGEGALTVDWSGDEPVPAFAPLRAEDAVLKRRGARFAEGVFSEVLMPRFRAVIFGAGHVGRALVPQLALVDFEVVVVDNRPEVALAEEHPAATRVILGDYASIADSVELRPRDFVCVTTSTHATDIRVLGQVLAAGPRYVGCLGGDRKRATVRERLGAQGFTEEQLDAIDMPMGIPLGDVTPAEVALSAAAKMVQVRSLG